MEDLPVNVSGMMSADFVHGIVKTTLEAYVVVKAVLLEFNFDAFESNDEALAGRRSVGSFDVQPEMQIVGIEPWIVGRFHAAFPRFDRGIR